MQLRIGICGAHGTGKTTLAQDLSEALGLPLITESARTVAKNLNIASCKQLGNNFLTADFQRKVLQAQLQAEIKHRREYA